VNTVTMMDSSSRRQLSKLASYALRHRPDLFGLHPDAEGRVTIEDFLRAARAAGGALTNVTAEDLAETIAKADKQRHELTAHSIRALYGHSLAETIAKPPADPPETLFHGTSPAAWARIRSEGLQPMSRQYVHLSVDQAMARQVGGRRGPEVVILAVQAAAASRSGIAFRVGNDRVWLADPIPPQFLSAPVPMVNSELTQ
jgi:putative RNA 2'-phosphotransferase